MKNIFYILIFTFVMFIPYNVYAEECSNDKINELKEMAKSVQISYEHDESGASNNDEKYNKSKRNDDGFEVQSGDMQINIAGFIKEIYIKDETNKRTFNYEDADNGILVLHYERYGSFNFNVYSNECKDIKLRSIYVRVPRYNIYNTDPYCEGISGEELAVCGEYYENDLDFEEFEKKALEYKAKKAKEAEEEERKNTFLYKLSTFVKNNYKYLIVFGILVIVVIGLLIFRRKRSELE